MGGMGFFFQSKELPRPASLTFTLKEAGHTYDDGHVGLAPTMLTISEQRVAVIGLNGAGKSTLLGLLDGSLKANIGTVTVSGGSEQLNPAVKKRPEAH
ncbi:ATP-binding protein of ABC transporter system [Bifidobacterium breve 2L]|nr:ATP-binding protein of ABC transporter system [Bifidobacterium breve 2L]EWH40885.1 ATP-binding protein of ABC transporter system [Bifidobacterium breve 31L]